MLSSPTLTNVHCHRQLIKELFVFQSYTMYLIYAGTDGKHNRLEMREFSGENIPKYAILSHTWGEDEITFAEMRSWSGRVERKQGFNKILSTCAQAQLDGISWVWVDTCCIDKSSSAELTEAINSMYAWYGGSTICYAYLADVPHGDDPFAERSAFRTSRWFTRSWTLQELIAPREVVFYDAWWRRIGMKCSTKWLTAEVDERDGLKRFGGLLEDITGIPIECLIDHRNPFLYSVAKRMSWASKRKCTRIEDIAYSLMGIFGVNMPLLYGEGAKAFIRLQEEIMKDTDDHSLFAWTLPEDDNQSWVVGSVFAQSPAAFTRSGNIIPVQEEAGELSLLTRKGLKINLGMRPAETSYIYRNHSTPEAFYAILNCARDSSTTQGVALLLIPEVSGITSQYRYFYRCATKEHIMAEINHEFYNVGAIYICKNVPPSVLQAFSPSVRPRQRLLGQAYVGLNTLQRIHYVASILVDLGQYGEAEVLYRRIQDRAEKELGGGHRYTLVNISNLAVVLQGLGRYEEANELHRQVVERREKVLGKDNLETIKSLENRASVLGHLGNYDEAEILQRCVLKRREKLLGKYHRDTLMSLSNLAVLLLKLGKDAEAESLYPQDAEARKMMLGGSHPDTVISLNNLGFVLLMLGKHEEAEMLCHRALETAETELGYEHADTLRCLRNLVLVLRYLGRDIEAEVLETYQRNKSLDRTTTGQLEKCSIYYATSQSDEETLVSSPSRTSFTPWDAQMDQRLLITRAPRVSRTGFNIKGHTTISGVYMRS
ncbi:hypothetical protein F5Y10DRAFT_249041 [Nemania abortiva]|nr:hypothetical protein F5Y10DRAFT_249041 [Nemania abortiva]